LVWVAGFKPAALRFQTGC